MKFGALYFLSGCLVTTGIVKIGSMADGGVAALFVSAILMAAFAAIMDAANS